MPRRSNFTGDLGYAKIDSDVCDIDNCYYSTDGIAYRHFTSDDKQEYYDEIIVAGEVPQADNPDEFGAPNPTFEFGDGIQSPK